MAVSVLIVEDDRNIAELLQLYLEKEGYAVTTAFDGGQGLTKFRSIKPDLVLLDVMMPVMDGWSVCKAIRSEAQTPIIMGFVGELQPSACFIGKAGAEMRLRNPACLGFSLTL